MTLLEDVEQLTTRLDKEAAGYRNQIDEARAAGLEHDCTLGIWTALRQATKDLRAIINKHHPPTTL